MPVDSLTSETKPIDRLKVERSLTKSPTFALFTLHLDAVDNIRMMKGQVFVQFFKDFFGNFANIRLDVLRLEGFFQFFLDSFTQRTIKFFGNHLLDLGLVALGQFFKDYLFESGTGDVH